MTNQKHYDYSLNGIKLDPYRILAVYGITHPSHQHAVKKLLRAGKSVKTLEQDIDETILSLQRWKEMIAEDDPQTETMVEEMPKTKTKCEHSCDCGATPHTLGASCCIYQLLDGKTKVKGAWALGCGCMIKAKAK